MAACKLPRKNADTLQASPASPVAVTGCTLADDLLLEIVARTDTRSLVRCAAACKLLRRDILSQSFINRVTQQGGVVPLRIVAHVNIHDDDKEDNPPPPPPLSLVHPATHAAVSFVDHLSAYMTRFAGDLFGDYYAVTSRGGLVLLCGHPTSDDELPNLCVYDLITGQRTIVPYPTCVDPNQGIDTCVLLTAADGIGCSFMLFATYLDTMTKLDGGYTGTFKVQTFTSTSCAWTPAVSSHDCSDFGFSLRRQKAAVVLQGGVIHWMVCHRGEIVTYNICTTEPGRIKLPHPAIDFRGRLYLGSYYSHDGQILLRLFGAHRFKISVWHQLFGGDWASEAMVIDTEEKLRSLDPDIPPGYRVSIEFKCSSEGSDVVLLHVNIYSVELPTGIRTLPVLLDLETKEMRLQQRSTSSSTLLEIDLRSRLREMKIFT